MSLAYRVQLDAAPNQTAIFNRLVRAHLGKFMDLGTCTLGVLLPVTSLKPNDLDKMEVRLGIKITGARVAHEHTVAEAMVPPARLDEFEENEVFRMFVVSRQPDEVQSLFADLASLVV